MNQGQMSPEVQNRGNSGPTKMTNILQKDFKKGGWEKWLEMQGILVPEALIVPLDVTNRGTSLEFNSSESSPPMEGDFYHDIWTIG